MALPCIPCRGGSCAFCTLGSEMCWLCPRTRTNPGSQVWHSDSCLHSVTLPQTDLSATTAHTPLPTPAERGRETERHRGRQKERTLKIMIIMMVMTLFTQKATKRKQLKFNDIYAWHLFKRTKHFLKQAPGCVKAMLLIKQPSPLEFLFPVECSYRRTNHHDMGMPPGDPPTS